jgi:Icc-related predicted phosphoesterase
MKISLISDTHNAHEKLGTLSGEVLIHCGDMLNLFSPDADELENIDDWFGRQDFDLILCTGGNHDLGLQRRAKTVTNPFKNAVYLEDRSYVHEGIIFYGAPWTPELRGQAFFKDDAELGEKWSTIPADTDVLITHTPPAGVLDVSSRGLKLGCEHLAYALQRVSPRLHCFGHVHASSGVREVDGTQFVNASSVNSQFELVRSPYEITL